VDYVVVTITTTASAAWKPMVLTLRPWQISTKAPVSLLKKMPDGKRFMEYKIEDVGDARIFKMSAKIL